MVAVVDVAQDRELEAELDRRGQRQRQAELAEGGRGPERRRAAGCASPATTVETVDTIMTVARPSSSVVMPNFKPVSEPRQ